MFACEWLKLGKAVHSSTTKQSEWLDKLKPHSLTGEFLPSKGLESANCGKQGFKHAYKDPFNNREALLAEC